MLINNENSRKRAERESMEEAIKRMVMRKIAHEEENAWRKDPEQVQKVRDSAKAATFT